MVFRQIMLETCTQYCWVAHEWVDKINTQFLGHIWP